MIRRKKHIGVGVIALIAMILIAIQHFYGIVPTTQRALKQIRDDRQHEIYIQSLIPKAGPDCFPGEMSGTLSVKAVERYDRLHRICLSRKQRNIVPEILPYLNDPEVKVRSAAVLFLGWQENAQAEPYLLALQQRQQQELVHWNKKDEIYLKRMVVIRKDPFTHENTITPVFPPQVKDIRIRIALAHIRARGLKGAAKLAMIAQNLGLSWDDVSRISREYFYNTSSMAGTDGETIIRHLVEVMYWMKTHGSKNEAIEADSMATSLSLHLSQKVWLQGIKLPIEQRIDLILNHASHVIALTEDEHELLETRLMKLGVRNVADRLIIMLKDVQQHPEKYPDSKHSVGRHALCLIAGLTHDRRLLPLILPFTKDSNQWTAQSALKAISKLGGRIPHNQGTGPTQ